MHCGLLSFRATKTKCYMCSLHYGLMFKKDCKGALFGAWKTKMACRQFFSIMSICNCTSFTVNTLQWFSAAKVNFDPQIRDFHNMQQIAFWHWQQSWNDNFIKLILPTNFINNWKSKNFQLLTCEDCLLFSVWSFGWRKQAISRSYLWLWEMLTFHWLNVSLINQFGP